VKRTIFCAARVHALNPHAAGGQALLVQSGRVTAVGAVEQLRALAPDAEIVDFGTATITPGLTDAHIHLLEWAISRRQVDLANARSIDEAVKVVATAPRRDGYVLGRGWNAHAWGGAYPTLEALDAVAPDVAVVLQSHDMHALWVNSRALQLAGIDERTPDPDGGRIVRTGGRPTGVLLENAAQLVVPHLPRYNPESVISLIEDAQAQLHRWGITAVHSFPAVHVLEPDVLPVVQMMRTRGLLQLRVLQHIALDKLDAAVSMGLRSGFGDEWLRMGGVKMFLDGALGSRTAFMAEPYENSSDHGVEVMSEADFRDAVRKAADNGIASTVHAIGDAAVRRAFQVLAAQAECQSAPLPIPHRVEHVQCLPEDCAPLLGMRVVCSVQPSHLMTDWRAADRHWGRRSAQTYAFRFMLDHGATLACGSDAPVENADPRHGLYAAITRRDLDGKPEDGWHPEQRISSREVWAAYTTGPTTLAGVAPALAGIAPGALADFVAWKHDPFAIEATGLLELQPAATIVGGQIVYTS